MPKVRSKKYGEIRKYLQGEKRLDKIHYYILLGLMIFWYVYNFFLQPAKIGHDKRYEIFIFWTPIIIGLIALGIYRRKLLINKLSANNGLGIRIIIVIFLLIQGLVVSYFTFGQATMMAWDFLNKNTAKQNPVETFNCRITRFWSKKSPYSIDYYFQGHYENIKVSYKTIKELRDKDPENYFLELEAQKGIWNYYILNSWSLRAK